MRNPIIGSVMLPALLLGAPQAGGNEPQAESTQVVARVNETKEREFTPPPGGAERHAIPDRGLLRRSGYSRYAADTA